MFNLFKRSPKAGVALANLSLLPVPTPADVPSDALPCEAAFTAPVEPDLDRDFFSAVAGWTKSPARYLPIDSLMALRPGHMGLGFPTFDLLDPFYQHPAGGPAETARAALQDLSTYGLSGIATLKKFPQNAGVLLGEAGPDALIETSLLTRSVPSNDAIKDKWMAARARYTFAFYCTLPGYIPPEYRAKIIAARDFAKAIGANVRLVIEANWKLAGEAVGRPDKADPLIVIRKGKNIAYIDRFDCTAPETNLAREHAVRIDR